MKMNIILKTMLNQRLWENIAERSLVAPKLEIDDGFARNHGDHISEKCDGWYEFCEVFSASSDEMFFYNSSE